MSEDREARIAPHRRRGRLHGQCLCGAVTIAIGGDYIAAVGICHCGRCQRWAGLAWGAFVASAEAVAGPVARYPSTPFAERAFCPRCGTHLWLRDRDAPAAEYELMPALFPQAAAFPLISEIYVDCRPAYVPLAGDHRTMTRADWEAQNRHIEGDLP